MILSGTKIRDIRLSQLRRKISSMSKVPKLLIIQVGDREDSNVYIRNKIKFGEKIGANVELKKYKITISEKELVKEIKKVGERKDVHGIIVQLPLPKQINPRAILESIPREKDVDGMSDGNLARLIVGQKIKEGNHHYFTPATAKGIITMLNFYKIKIPGQNVVVVGRSMLVGKPIALALLNRDATVTICHTKTKNPVSIMKSADIVIVAAGSPKYFNSKYFKKGQTVIDVGINSKNGILCGDVDFEKVSKIVANISPVPGGVGPLTVLSLFENLFEAVRLSR